MAPRRDHRRPLIAFVVVLVLAAAVIGNGLRADALRPSWLAAERVTLIPRGSTAGGAVPSPSSGSSVASVWAAGLLGRAVVPSRPGPPAWSDPGIHGNDHGPSRARVGPGTLIDAAAAGDANAVRHDERSDRQCGRTDRILRERARHDRRPSTRVLRPARHLDGDARTDGRAGADGPGRTAGLS